MQFNFNEHTLDLGEVNVDTENFAMKGESSYVDAFYKRYKTKKNYREAMLPLKIQCLVNIRQALDDNYHSYLDLLAGIGISGKIFDRGVSTFNDFAPDCVEILKKNFGNAATCIDMFDYPWAKYSFIFGDFNNYTLKKAVTLYKPVVDAMFANATKYVLINDCSVFYLRYGKTSWDNYARIMGVKGLNKSNYHEHLKAFYAKLYPDWRLAWVEAHKDTQFLLFERTESHLNNFTFSLNTKENLNVKISLYE